MLILKSIDSKALDYVARQITKLGNSYVIPQAKQGDLLVRKAVLCSSINLSSVKVPENVQVNIKS